MSDDWQLVSLYSNLADPQWRAAIVKVVAERDAAVARAERAEADADRLAVTLRRLAETPVTADPEVYSIEQWQCDVDLVTLTLNAHDALVAEQEGGTA